MKKVTRDKLLKTLAVIVLPGGIPIFLGYTVYQLYKRNRVEKEKDDEERSKSNSEDVRDGSI